MRFHPRYVHTNIVANDYKKLSAFYEKVFECRPVPPERDLKGPWLEEGTGVAGAHIKGIHLRLPGCGDEGPTLEIFQYNRNVGDYEKRVNRLGFAHIAFSVENVEEAQDAVKRAGGRDVGKRVSVQIPNTGEITFVYVADPEGNIIELQQWL
jgi:predicted enzyme related to lactoylglutathione lyase